MYGSYLFVFSVFIGCTVGAMPIGAVMDAVVEAITFEPARVSEVFRLLLKLRLKRYHHKLHSSGEDLTEHVHPDHAAIHLDSAREDLQKRMTHTSRRQSKVRKPTLTAQKNMLGGLEA